MALPITALLGLLSLAVSPARPLPAPAREPHFLFDLATSTGTSESTWASLAYDRQHDELFAIHGGQVHVFNQAGMETYTFGGNGDLGSVERVALFESGEMLLLANVNGRRTIVRCDYRGEPIGPFEVKPIPEEFTGFDPDRILVQGGKVYLVATASMRVLVADGQGMVEQAYDLASMVRAKDPEIKTGMSGFWADAQGNFVFTMPYAFTAFAMSPSRELRQFGTRGSSPGKFNIVGAVATDEQGNLFVLDRLRSVVLVFNPSLKFVLEFGYRGEGPTNLIAPYDLSVGNGKVFVSQARDRGVKVFQYDPSDLTIPPAGAAGG